MLQEGGIIVMEVIINEVGTYHFTQAPKSLLPSMTWILTWQHFLKVKLGICVENWVEQKTKPNSQHKSPQFFCKNNQLL